MSLSKVFQENIFLLLNHASLLFQSNGTQGRSQIWQFTSHTLEVHRPPRKFTGRTLYSKFPTHEIWQFTSFSSTASLIRLEKRNSMKYQREPEGTKEAVILSYFPHFGKCFEMHYIPSKALSSFDLNRFINSFFLLGIAYAFTECN